MEFNEKLQELRRQKGLTQEELAEALWVSRTAVSKWESGRGYPSIDSLKQISKYFSVSIDALLSGDQLLTIAEADQKTQQNRFQDLIFGLLDISVVLFLFLPFFSQTASGVLEAVSLSALTEIPGYMQVAYFVPVAGLILFGVCTLALQNSQNTLWVRWKRLISLLLNSCGTLLFIISPQPYAAAFLFVFLLIKVLILAKKQ